MTPDIASGGAGRINLSRESAHKVRAHASEEASDNAAAIAPLAPAHGSATPAAGNVGTVVRGGPAFRSSPVAKSGVTVGGDESGTAAHLSSIGSLRSPMVARPAALRPLGASDVALSRGAA